ncbi:MAG: CHASE domain-containing protein [Oscillatoriaceae bacterium SKW80]|nr:CHASE domain-containing protein [Oscillatoriaceae bacterium SKYG93]MCX8122146.1 CHASE domain-containing protein [Oscillatoriaceae bacterium SKW80]MDW8454433.1 adenylate/guanylate cyclase domain-containing protein [Oscillatoriaceae cyanobacterium SKYGB_i_bin93]HIK29297.1 CHASE domain-containing protein [Oscillatoriaceae cyanobacterium M7585_C2015_266]
MSNTKTLPFARYLPVGLTLGLGVGLSVLAFALVWRWENQRRDYEFNRYADSVANSLQQRFNDNLEVIPNINDFFIASGKIERAEFRQFVQRPLLKNPNIQYLAWVPVVRVHQRIAYEEAARADKLPNFQISELDASGKIVKARDRPEYWPIYYIEPMKENEKVLGFDLGSHPVLREVLQQARATGKMIVTKQNGLLQENDTQLSLLAIQPVYKNKVSQESTDISESEPSIGDKQLQGFIVGVFRIADIFQEGLIGRSSANFDLYLAEQDKTSSSAPSFLSFYNASTKQVEKSNQLNRSARENQAEGKRTLTVGDSKWILYLLTTEEYRDIQTKHWRSWATLIIGLLWTHIPVTYLLTSIFRQRQIEELAQERARQAEQLRFALEQLSAEQEKSERLLLNILPEAIASRLKQHQAIIADSFPEVTVMFADIVGFTQIASQMEATALVQILNEIFSAFDKLAVQHGLEKIKTIGDAYMVVGGLPQPRPDHAQAIAEMALDMLEEISRFNATHHKSFRIRIGIHTGPVVAGVIGTNKFVYDLWGDTVNIASRMESHGLPNCIQVSKATYELLCDTYDFQERGRIQIKGKGKMSTYLLLGRRLSNYSNSQALPAGKFSQALKEQLFNNNYAPASFFHTPDKLETL